MTDMTDTNAKKGTCQACAAAGSDKEPKSGPCSCYESTDLDPLAKLICDVCNAQPVIGLASSSFGPITHAYCARCAAMQVEPLFMFDFMYEHVSRQGEGLSPWVFSYFTYENSEFVSMIDYINKRRAADGLGPMSAPELQPVATGPHGDD